MDDSIGDAWPEELYSVLCLRDPPGTGILELEDDTGGTKDGIDWEYLVGIEAGSLIFLSAFIHKLSSSESFASFGTLGFLDSRGSFVSAELGDSSGLTGVNGDN